MTRIVLSLFLLLSLTAQAQTQVQQYEVYALQFAALAKPAPLTFFVAKAPPKDSVKTVFMFWLIKGNQKTILVDAGFLKDVEDAKGYGFAAYQRPDSTLLALGIRPEQVTDVILSHPHWDHADGINLFPKAHVWLQKKDFAYFTGTAWQKDGARHDFNPRDVRKLVELNLAGRLTLIDGDNQEIIPGIHVFTGSKHTFESQYVVVKNARNPVIIASDNVWVTYNLEHLMSPPAGGTMAPLDYVAAMKRMKTMVSSPKFILPGHDGSVLSKFPAVKPGIIKIQ